MPQAEWAAPEPSAQEHSERLIAFIRAEIDAAGGAISFERYMELVLYAPGLGYYAAGARKFGEHGDFVTAPEVSSLFARCLARQCASVFGEIGRTDILELGAGSGAMAADILVELAAVDSLPRHYFILEVSPDLRERQASRLRQALPSDLFARVQWIDAPPDPFEGVILANEVLDALPVTRFRVDETGFHEEMVAWNGARFESRWQPANEILRGRLQSVLAELPPLELPYVSEVCPRLPAFVKLLGQALSKGAMLFIDYGYPRGEYYLPERSMGTLMCHYRHRAHDDPFVFPGLQDITAFVDFTSVAEAGVEAGLELQGFTTQAQFLLGAGLTDILPRVDPGDTLRSLKISQEVQKLTLPGEMGDRFRVMGLSRELDLALSGFSLRDYSSTL